MSVFCCLLLPSVSARPGLRPVRGRGCVRPPLSFRLSLSWACLPSCSGSVRPCLVPAPPALRRPSVCPGPAPSVLVYGLPFFRLRIGPASAVRGLRPPPAVLRCSGVAVLALCCPAPPVRTACQQFQQQHGGAYPRGMATTNGGGQIYATTREKCKKTTSKNSTKNKKGIHVIKVL